MYQLPETVTDNDETYMLAPGMYDNGLTIYGNNFTLIGNDVESCNSTNQTEIVGDVVIYGNNATFENIKFNGSVIENWTGAQFIDCCF
ncbi:MAG: hypothetical protein JRF71_12000 [Deltaproteobacteria bacterium]|jgi:hypothetical protein|nr:hypothetical protein [Deltaproteobacteria bacterium]